MKADGPVRRTGGRSPRSSSLRPLRRGGLRLSRRSVRFLPRRSVRFLPRRSSGSRRVVPSGSRRAVVCFLPRRSVRFILGAAALVAALTGCRVQTQVVIDQAPSGRGVVTVTASLDRSALAAIGGAPALAAQLQTADLRAAGWTVTGPRAGPGSTSVVSASHSFATPAQASALLADLAGSGPDGGARRPFQVLVQKRQGSGATDDDATWPGRPDVRGQLLRRLPGSPAPSAFQPASTLPPGRGAGNQPDQVFTFSLDARLPGQVVNSNATALPDGSVRWTPRLGQRLQLAAPHPNLEHRAHRGGDRDRRRGRQPGCGAGGVLVATPAAPQARPRPPAPGQAVGDGCLGAVVGLTPGRGAGGRPRRWGVAAEWRCHTPVVRWPAWPARNLASLHRVRLPSPRWAGRCGLAGPGTRLVEEIDSPPTRTMRVRRASPCRAHRPGRHRCRLGHHPVRPGCPSSTGCSAAG